MDNELDKIELYLIAFKSLAIAEFFICSAWFYIEGLI
jgi:hypothetical protein